MERMKQSVLRWLVLGAALSAGISACDKHAPGSRASKRAAEKAAKEAHDHSGWWCDEHGIPEAECSMCNSKVAAEFKKKGDWCDKHERAKSQCFICDPTLKERFAAQYTAKFGKAPPPLPEEDKKEETSQVPKKG